MQQKAFANTQQSSYASMTLLRISVGIVYLWFGGLKFFNGVSPAEHLAMQTIHTLTIGFMRDHTSIIILAVIECLIGILLVTGRFVKLALCLLFPHMACTFMPFLFSPETTFRFVPYELTLTGQYIVKNIIIIAVGIVLWRAESEKDTTVPE